MRPFAFVLSIAAGAVLFFLLAKVLIFGLMLFIPLALMAALVLGIRRKLVYGHYYGYHQRFARRYSMEGEQLGYPRLSRPESLEDYRTIIVE
ncbi:MAG: hypothetical protein KDD06_11525 [Phaeodactylibacter sp.]|nr:hypothetical protein [Phaeodactylibacter sp.]MCB9290815.1 hypothetical protein [Lewinellaceae bacterium]